MRIWLLVGVFLPLSLSVAEPRQCEKEMKEILALDGTILGPITDTKTLTQMKTELADADVAYQAAFQKAPPAYNRYSDQKQLRTPEGLDYAKDFNYDERRYKQYIEVLRDEKRAKNDAHERAMAPSSERLNKARGPFNEADGTGMSQWNFTGGLSTFYFDKVEQHGTDPQHLNRVYSQGNRITGLVMNQFDTRLTFRFNDDCSIQKIMESSNSSDGRGWPNWTITPQLCRNRNWDKTRDAATISELGGYVRQYADNPTPQMVNDLRRSCDSFAKLFNLAGKTSIVTPKPPDK